MDGVVLRYGFFYGQNTWYCPEGAAAGRARRQEIPITGLWEWVWSFVHIEDAALATVAALTAPPGLYNVVDDDPSPVSGWLSAFSRWVGAPPPLQVTEREGAGTRRRGRRVLWYEASWCFQRSGSGYSGRPRLCELTSSICLEVSSCDDKYGNWDNNLLLQKVPCFYKNVPERGIREEFSSCQLSKRKGLHSSAWRVG
jgi:hypothetical protein